MLADTWLFQGWKVEVGLLGYIPPIFPPFCFVLIAQWESKYFALAPPQVASCIIEHLCLTLTCQACSYSSLTTSPEQTVVQEGI